MSWRDSAVATVKPLRIRRAALPSTVRILADSLDIAGGIGDPPIAIAAESEVPYKIVYIECETGTAEGLAVRASTGIEKIEELKGKTIATVVTSTSHYSLLAALESRGLSANDVKILDLTAPDSVAAWERGDIDFVYTWEPHLSALAASGGKIRITSKEVAEQGSPVSNYVIVRTKFAEQYPEIVTEFIRNMIRAGDLYRESPDKAAKIWAEFLSITPEEATLQAQGSHWLTVEEILSPDRLGVAGEGLAMLGALPTITPPCWTTLATGAWPTSSNPNLHVVDGTQPGSVNMGIAQMDWEKIIVASEAFQKLQYIRHTEKAAGAGCIISDLNEVTDIGAGAEGKDDQWMELWWGDKARVSGEEIRTYIKTNEDTETFVGGRVGYDSVHSPLAPARGFAGAPQDARTFTVLISSGEEERHGLIWKDPKSGTYRVRLFRSQTDREPILEFGSETIVYAVDAVTKNGETKQACRGYNLLDVAEDLRSLRIWISNALDISNDTLWHPGDLLQDVREYAEEVPPVSLIGGEDADLVDKVFLPSWDAYNQWQARALHRLISENNYEVVFSHLHNVDCAGHQFWHLAKNLEPWSHTYENVYRKFIEDVYVQTDHYLGAFLDLLDQDWTIYI